MLRKTMIAAAISLAAISTTAAASVTFDSVSGTGFVGKGDVQLAFGWNNKAAQDNAKAVVFTYEVSDSYDVTCEWDTGTRNVTHHVVNHPKHVNINAAIAYDARQKNQYTGYILSGFGTSTSDGVLPEVGAACPNGNSGVITAVEYLGGNGGGLYVTFNGTKVALPNTPTL